MVEVELKLQVPPAQRDAVRRAVATASARTTRLQARYFDTPDRRLAAAGIALRLRREDSHWVQTLKARGDGVMARPEHNAVLPRTRGEPVLDVARHDGTPAGDALRATGVDATALQPLFATDVRRTHRRVRHGGAVVELAYDDGVLVAGERREPVAELELELVSGAPAALFALAARWIERHGLWLDVRTKAECGDLLARDERASPAVHATAPALRTGATPAEALRAMVRSCLDQILPNASVVAAGRHDAEHVHQLRVGLRRLRTALREFGDAAAEVDPAWEPALAAVFARLGAARDRDALAATLLPALAAAGAPVVALAPVADAEDPGQALREPAWNLLLLALIGFAHGDEPAAAPGAEPSWALPPADDADALRRWMRQRLKRAHRRAVADAAAFATLPEDAQHRVRKRVKRLRYAVEFVAALYSAKAVARYLKRLRPAQEALGEYNDVLVAEAAFRELVASDPRAWFALGWLAARRAQCLAKCTRALQRLADAEPFWRGRH
ncbi:CYTH and CHAD domain-containing protein [Azohydromonas sediminis]|uniref:CYTH and CHAD domain-containing protein n=1 Tax=Azohydromonas sediminis TaxID=2259674 RepID=UPI000E6531EE|nr:CYTH and CHAD domain-containing protein [Azohydromonas sediminis]